MVTVDMCSDKYVRAIKYTGCLQYEGIISGIDCIAENSEKVHINVYSIWSYL